MRGMGRAGLTCAAVMLTVSMVGWQPAVAKSVRPAGAGTPAVLDYPMAAPHAVRPVAVAAARVPAVAPVVRGAATQEGGTSIVGTKHKKACKPQKNIGDLLVFLSFGGEISDLNRKHMESLLESVRQDIADVRGQRASIRNDKKISGSCRDEALSVLGEDLAFLEDLQMDLQIHVDDIEQLFDDEGFGAPLSNGNVAKIRMGTLHRESGFDGGSFGRRL